MERPIFVWVIFTCVSKISSSTQNVIFTIINNYFRSIQFHLGLEKDDESCMWTLINTEATMNTGNKNYHLQVILYCPRMVSECLQCGEGAKVEVV